MTTFVKDFAKFHLVTARHCRQIIYLLSRNESPG